MEMALGKVDEFVLDFNNQLHKCDNYIEQNIQEQRDQFEAAYRGLSISPPVQPAPEPVVVYQEPVPAPAP